MASYGWTREGVRYEVEPDGSASTLERAPCELFSPTSWLPS
jgi:hypothetical protein